MTAVGMDLDGRAEVIDLSAAASTGAAIGYARLVPIPALHAIPAFAIRASAFPSCRRLLGATAFGAEWIVEAMPDYRCGAGLEKWTMDRLEEFLEECEREGGTPADSGNPVLTYAAVRVELARRRSEQL